MYDSSHRRQVVKRRELNSFAFERRAYVARTERPHLDAPLPLIHRVEILCVAGMTGELRHPLAETREQRHESADADQVRQEVARCRLSVKSPAVANTWCEMAKRYA